MEWVITCNTKAYNVIGAFKKFDTIDWKQSTNVKVGDIIYIYVGSPVGAISYMCEATMVELAEDLIDDSEFVLDDSNYGNYGRYMRLHLLQCFDDERLNFKNLKENGLKTVQGPSKVSPELSAYLADSIKAVSNGEIIEPLDNTHSFEEQQMQAESMDMESLKAAALRKSEKKTIEKEVVVKQISRDPYVAEYAKQRAKGVCQLCGKEAPFTDAKGKPYLESHHIDWLANGGEDSVANTVGLCPNCHRKMHIVADKEDVQFLQRIARSY